MNKKTAFIVGVKLSLKKGNRMEFRGINVQLAEKYFR